MPLAAQAASWMEATQLPLHEAKKRYTKSEMVVAAWRNAEIAHNMEKNRLSAPMSREVEERVPPSIVDKATTPEGELDLRKLTDDEVFAYFASIGMPIARMG